MGDKLSRGTCPEGDNRDTPIGGVSRLSRLRSGEPVPGLRVIDRIEHIEGDPRQEWAWTDAALVAGNPHQQVEPIDGLFPVAHPKGSAEVASPSKPDGVGTVDPSTEPTHHKTHQTRKAVARE